MIPRAGSIRERLKHALPASVRDWLRSRDGGGVEPLSLSNGLPRRVRPVSHMWGFDRGLPVDRHYIERFLECHAGDVRGRVLEVADPSYTRRFGGDRVEVADVLDVTAANPKANVIADLNDAPDLPADAYDCAIITQTLHLIYDVRKALAALHRTLKPGGVLLATVPGITRISWDECPGSWYWSFSTNSMKRLLAEAFPGGEFQVESHGNVLAASAFLYGLAAAELRPEELEFHDPQFELVVAVRAAKAGRPGG